MGVDLKNVSNQYLYIIYSENFNEIRLIAFALAWDPHYDSKTSDRRFFKSLFWAQGTPKWIFPLTTQHRVFYNHNTFSIHSLGEKVKLFIHINKVKYFVCTLLR